MEYKELTDKIIGCAYKVRDMNYYKKNPVNLVNPV